MKNQCKATELKEDVLSFYHDCYVCLITGLALSIFVNHLICTPQALLSVWHQPVVALSLVITWSDIYCPLFLALCQFPPSFKHEFMRFLCGNFAIVSNLNVDMPDCKSIVRQENFHFASEQMSQLLAPLPGCSGCRGSSMPCRNTTMPTQSEHTGAPWTKKQAKLEKVKVETVLSSTSETFQYCCSQWTKLNFICGWRWRL